MHKNATKCNETLSKWCKNKHGASKIIDTLETYQYATIAMIYFTLLPSVLTRREKIMVGSSFSRARPSHH
jgi:hypothetical protein